MYFFSPKIFCFPSVTAFFCQGMLQKQLLWHIAKTWLFLQSNLWLEITTKCKMRKFKSGCWRYFCPKCYLRALKESMVILGSSFPFQYFLYYFCVTFKCHIPETCYVFPGKTKEAVTQAVRFLIWSLSGAMEKLDYGHCSI